jgi:hypothetical protein
MENETKNIHPLTSTMEQILMTRMVDDFELELQVDCRLLRQYSQDANRHSLIIWRIQDMRRSLENLANFMRENEQKVREINEQSKAVPYHVAVLDQRK